VEHLGAPADDRHVVTARANDRAIVRPMPVPPTGHDDASGHPIGPSI
jgi:hypothetical protein